MDVTLEIPGAVARTRSVVLETSMLKELEEMGMPSELLNYIQTIAPSKRAVLGYPQEQAAITFHENW
ncbi:MAG: hypothetical protein JRN38_02550 [Nitrososphaerota archaeon]|nr:hypothetical protein [Nitrososphaerota archaeon]